jgi:hypothetical protein
MRQKSQPSKQKSATKSRIGSSTYYRSPARSLMMTALLNGQPFYHRSPRELRLSMQKPNACSCLQGYPFHPSHSRTSDLVASEARDFGVSGVVSEGILRFTVFWTKFQVLPVDTVVSASLTRVIVSAPSRSGFTKRQTLMRYLQ